MKGVCIFLASHASDYLNGAVIPVDGSYSPVSNRIQNATVYLANPILFKKFYGFFLKCVAILFLLYIMYLHM